MSAQSLPHNHSAPGFWRKLAPQLTIGERADNHDAIKFDRSVLSAISNTLGQDGYLHLPQQFCRQQTDPVYMGIKALESEGIPAVYIYLFDQPWVLFSRLGQLIRYFLGANFALLPNFWAWNIPARKGASGWPPHQDCQARTRYSDGSGGDILLSLSLWLPLSDATLENGCMSVLPRSNEHHYDMPLDDPADIRSEHGLALPVQAGSVLGWAQDLYHWSNRVTEKAEGPRLSLSFEFQNRAFEPLSEPLLDVHTPPDFETRLRLIKMQFARYRHMESAR